VSDGQVPAGAAAPVVGVVEVGVPGGNDGAGVGALDVVGAAGLGAAVVEVEVEVAGDAGGDGIPAAPPEASAGAVDVVGCGMEAAARSRGAAEAHAEQENMATAMAAAARRVVVRLVMWLGRDATSAPAPVCPSR